jgi:hypothetical protein
MQYVIVHYHIFKNAGSTIEDILDQSFGARFDRLETPDSGSIIPNADVARWLRARPKLRAFSSHQIRYPLPRIPGCLLFDICFLRDPLDRLRSFYDYFRQKPNPSDPISNLANEYTLGDFATRLIVHHPRYIRNSQVNFLACAGSSAEPDERDLDLAIRRITATSFLGVVDCFEQSAIAGADSLQYAFPELKCDRPPANTSKGMVGTVNDRIAGLRLACGESVYEELFRITALDRRLVEHARAEVLRRLNARFERPHQRGLHQTGLHQTGSNQKAGFVSRARELARVIPYWRELRSMRGSLFDAEFYLRKYPDVAAAGVNPLLHYLKCGRKESRQPNPVFDPAFYLSHNPDARRKQTDALLHYLRSATAEDRKPHPLFEPSHYRWNNLPGSLKGAGPLAHFLGAGTECARPHPLFDCDAYRDAHPDVVAKGVNPLVHYLESAGRDRVIPEPNTAAVRRLEDAQVIQLDLDDVLLTVFCAKGVSRLSKRDLHSAAVARAACLGIRGSVAIVSQGTQGAAHWIAEPQQMPFLRAVGIDQILAQTGPVRSGQRLRVPLRADLLRMSGAQTEPSSPQYQFSVKDTAE